VATCDSGHTCEILGFKLAYFVCDDQCFSVGTNKDNKGSAAAMVMSCALLHKTLNTHSNIKHDGCEGKIGKNAKNVSDNGDQGG